MAISPDEFYLNSFSFGYKLRKKSKVKKIKKVKKINVKRLSRKYKLSVPRARKILKSIKTKNTKKKMKLFKKKVNAFGKKKRWIQSVTKTFAKKGTKGAFTRWCKRKGYKGVTAGCIKRGKRDRSLRTRRRAIFAENIRH
jgi:hypothetical protein